jgi:signal transduction histidine kinase
MPTRPATTDGSVVTTGPGLPIRFGGPRGDADGDLTLWRAVGVFRWISLGYAVLLYVRAVDDYRHPVGGWLVLAAMVAWTLTWTLAWTPALGRGRTLTVPVLLADLLLATTAVLSTRLLDDPARIAGGEQTLPVIWPAAAVLGWAVWRGRRGGLAAAAVLSVADLVEVRGLSASTVNNIVLLLLVGSIVGYAVELSRQARRDLAVAVSVQAAAAERERLAGDIHDSVLQVLAFIQRRGAELGGEVAELGRLAADQEARLRSLVAGPASTRVGPAGERDLAAALAVLAGSRVCVSAPAGPVLLAAQVVDAACGAVGAALDNVTRHAGPAATAWVLVEDEGSRVLVTVRDDGVGLLPGRLAEAAGEGRLGVAASIISRVAAVGGTARVLGSPGQGTEVELELPR